MKYKEIEVEVSEETWEKLEFIARAKGCTLEELVENYISQYVEAW